jgi:hypothetical protein
MVDFKGWARLLVLGGAILGLFTIASQPGLWGKAFAIGVIWMLWMMFQRMQKANERPKAIDTYYEKLRMTCKINGAKGLQMLKMTGDAANAWYTKGKILGVTRELMLPKPGLAEYSTDKKVREQQVKERNAELAELDINPKKIKWIFLYTPDTGWMYRFPIISWIMKNYRREILFAVFHNPKASTSQLLSGQSLTSMDYKDHHYHFYGDVEVRGITTVMHRDPRGPTMEFVNDEYYDPKFEDSLLFEHVQRITLHEFMNEFVDFTMVAAKADSSHNKETDKFNLYGGEAKPGNAT